MTMKKNIIIAIILSLVLASCEVNSFQDAGVTRNELIQFTTRTFGTYVIIPIETAEVLIDFDKYLQLSDDDKEADTRFYGNVEQIYDDVYKISDAYEHHITCVVKTGGISLQTVGATWEFASLKLEGSDPIIENYYGLSYEFPEGLKLVTTGAQEWTMVGDDFDTKMVYQGEDNGRDMWQVYAKGTITSANRVSAKFTTISSGVSVKELTKEPGSLSRYRGNAYGGKFNIDLYNSKGTHIDYCYMNLTPGFITRFQTSKDKEEDR